MKGAKSFKMNYVTGVENTELGSSLNNEINKFNYRRMCSKSFRLKLKTLKTYEILTSTPY